VGIFTHKMQKGFEKSVVCLLREKTDFLLVYTFRMEVDGEGRENVDTSRLTEIGKKFLYELSEEIMIFFLCLFRIEAINKNVEDIKNNVWALTKLSEKVRRDI
jgi:hypothetical protein